jgi:predicted DNA-binding transcriptional regulator AlpA
MAPKVEPAELVTAADIARRLGVSPQRTHQLTQQNRFPAPVGRIATSNVWRWSDVERWARQRSRERWIAEAVALVPRTGGMLQSMFRMTLQNRLANALGSKPEMPDASVADVVTAAIADLDGRGLPRFDPQLLQLDWPQERRQPWHLRLPNS